MVVVPTKLEDLDKRGLVEIAVSSSKGEEIKILVSGSSMISCFSNIAGFMEVGDEMGGVGSRKECLGDCLIVTGRIGEGIFQRDSKFEFALLGIGKYHRGKELLRGIKIEKNS